MLLTFGAAIVLLGALIFIHELGHFVAAKSLGMGVHRFSLGLGSPSPLKFTWGETEYAISWIPFGGYVKVASKGDAEQGIMGEMEGGAGEREFAPERYFENKPIWARLIFVTAGVAMNLMFAFAAYTMLAKVYGQTEDPTTRIAAVDTTGLPALARPLAAVPFGATVLKVNGDTVESWGDLTDLVLAPSGDRLRFDFAPPVDPVILPIPATRESDRAGVVRALIPLWEPRIGVVAPGHPADRAGLRINDVIVTAAGDSVRYWQQLVQAIESRVGDSLVLGVRRGDATLRIAMVPQGEEVRDIPNGTRRTVGRVGIGPLITPRTTTFSLGRSLVEGGRHTWGDLSRFWLTLKSYAVGQASPKDLASPILIGQVSGEMARLGLAPFMAFMAFISVNLAGLNILPIPLLDGGHVLFLLIEGARGKPLSLNLRMRLSQIGLVILLAIAGIAIANDVIREVMRYFNS
ncbi:MAG TPA: RIP metalloprotease RseP [Gemmatimonadales bacterium]